LWVVDVIGHLGVDGLADMQQCVGAIIESILVASLQEEVTKRDIAINPDLTLIVVQ
jgi:hypothetical protein